MVKARVTVFLHSRSRAPTSSLLAPQASTGTSSGRRDVLTSLPHHSTCTHNLACNLPLRLPLPPSLCPLTYSASSRRRARLHALSSPPPKRALASHLAAHRRAQAHARPRATSQVRASADGRPPFPPPRPKSAAAQTPTRRTRQTPPRPHPSPPPSPRRPRPAFSLFTPVVSLKYFCFDPFQLFKGMKAKYHSITGI